MASWSNEVVVRFDQHDRHALERLSRQLEELLILLRKQVGEPPPPPENIAAEFMGDGGTLRIYIPSQETSE